MSTVGSRQPRPSTRAAVDAAGAATLDGLSRRSRGDAVKGRLFYLVVWFCGFIGVAGLITLVVKAVVDGWAAFDLSLITNPASSLGDEAGYGVAIVGSLIIMAGVVLTVVPLGVGTAIYLEEFSDKTRWWNRAIEVNVANLAAVPSIVFGILGLGLIVRDGLSLGPVAYAGSLTLSLLVLPTVILASREALRAVPDSIRQGSLALGATPVQTVFRQVLPAAIPGIITGTILSLARAIGETAPLLLVGAVVFVTANPESPFEGSYTAVPVQIFQYVTRPQDEFQVTAAAGIIVLLAVLMVFNSFAIWLRNRYQRRW